MLTRTQFLTLTLLAGVTLLLAVANMFMFSQNREKQLEVNSRAQYIQQTVQLEGLYREMVKALAELAVRNNDKEIRDMLSAQGISVTVNQAPAPAAAPAAQPAPAADPKKAGR